MNKTTIEWTDYTSNLIKYRDPEGRTHALAFDSGSRCESGHPLVLVAEGYAYCSDGMEAASPVSWWPWRLTPPRPDLGHSWTDDFIRGRDRRRLTAWRGKEAHSLAAVLAFIQEDIEAHRELPYDEDRERARLRPV